MPISSPNQLLTQGYRCPDPVLLIRKRIRMMNSGEILHVFSDDISTTRDIPTFCQFMEHSLIKKQVDELPYQFWIKKS
jgi:tRNA 2-thiouridine synthesizing protein A